MTVTCECGKYYDVPSTLEGKSFRCKACQKLVHVPLPWRLEELTEIVPDDEPAKPDNVLMPHPTHRHGHVMSNKDLLTFSLSRFVKCHPLTVYLPFMILIACLLITAITQLPLMIGLFVGFIPAAILFTEGPAKKASRQLQNGRLCAAVVVTTNPYAIAVLSNLSHDGSARRLAISLQRQRLGNMAGGSPKKGDHLLATSTFTGKLTEGDWESFESLAVNCACDNLQQILQASLKIDPKDWTLLENELAKTKLKMNETIKLP